MGRAGIQEHGRRDDGGVQIGVGSSGVCGVDAAADRAPLPAGRAEAPSADRPGRRRVDGAERRVLRHAFDRGGALLRQGRSGRDPGVAGGTNAGRPARRDPFRLRRCARAQRVPRTGRGVRRPMDEACGRDRRRRRLAPARTAPLGAAGSLRGSRRGALGRGALAECRACGGTAGGAGLRGARDRQEPSASLAAHGAHGEGFAVLWGACSEELAVPYEPWIAVCSQLVEHAPAELLERHVTRHGGELARLARDLPRRLPGAPEPESSDPETERFLLFSAVSGPSWSWRRRCPCASCSTTCTGRICSRSRC